MRFCTPHTTVNAAGLSCGKAFTPSTSPYSTLSPKIHRDHIFPMMCIQPPWRNIEDSKVKFQLVKMTSVLVNPDTFIPVLQAKIAE